MSYIAMNFDRTGYQQDLNVVFPLDWLLELEIQRFIRSVAEYYYYFMGATDPQKMESVISELTKVMKKDAVTSVLLVPV